MNYYSASFARTKPIDPSSSKSFRKRRKKEEIIIARIIDRKLVLQRNKKKRGRVIETLNECIPSSSSCLSNTSSSWSSKVCPRVLRIVLTFSFSIRPDLVESNMEKALLSTVKNNRILSSCLDDIYILFINKRILFRRSAFSCERFREENLLLAVLLLEAINRFRDRHLASRIDRSSLKLNVYAFRVNKMRGGQLFSKKIKHSRPSIRGYGKWKLYTCWRARARVCVKRIQLREEARISIYEANSIPRLVSQRRPVGGSGFLLTFHLLAVILEQNDRYRVIALFFHPPHPSPFLFLTKKKLSRNTNTFTSNETSRIWSRFDSLSPVRQSLYRGG